MGSLQRILSLFKFDKKQLKKAAAVLNSLSFPANFAGKFLSDFPGAARNAVPARAWEFSGKENKPAKGGVWNGFSRFQTLNYASNQQTKGLYWTFQALKVNFRA